MRTEKIEIYEFNELSDEAKEKAINEHRETMKRDPFVFEFEQECFLDYWKERLQEIGFEDAVISYFGFYSQGDGLSFTSEINPEKVIDSMIMAGYLPKDKAILYDKLLSLHDLKIIELWMEVRRMPGSRSRYFHENTIYVYDTSEFYLNDCNEAYDYFNMVFIHLADYIQEYVRELCQHIYYELQKEYEYMFTDEYIEDFLVNNEYEFLKDGSVY